MKTKYLTLAALAFIMAACNNDNVTHPPIAARFSAEIYDATQTRASGASWEDGDEIGISATGGGYTNVKYTTADLGTTFTTKTPFYFQDENNVTFTAYYPYNESASTDVILENNTEAENQKTDKQKTIDYMFASEASASQSSPTVNFTFKHKMSQITLTFIARGGVSFANPINYSLDGLRMTGTFNTSNGEATATGDAAKQLKIERVSLGSSPITVAPVILYPQTITEVSGVSQIKLSVELGGQIYSCALKTGEVDSQETLTKLEAGKNYKFDITVSKTGLSVGQSTIDEWESVTGSGTAEL